MDQEEEKGYFFNMTLQKKSFAGAFKDHSEAHQILSNINFSTLTGFKIRLPQQIHFINLLNSANELIDDWDFDKVVFLFENQNLSPDSMSHILINSENRNFLSPKTYYKILHSFTSNLKMLSLNIQDNAGLEINDWLTYLSRIIQSSFQLNQMFIQIPQFISILNKGYFSIKIKSGIKIDETCFKSLALLSSKFQFHSFRLKIEDDNAIKDGLDNFGPILQNCQELNSFSLTIGKTCQLNSLKILQYLENQPITFFKLKIGNSNQIDSQVLSTIQRLVQNKLTQLNLQVGSSTKIFRSFQLLPIQHSKLEKLCLRIGQNNDFQNGGAKFLALLLESSLLQMVKISIGDSNQMTDLQALQIFILLQKLRTVKILELEFERNICVNKYCLDQLEQLINKSNNLSNLSLDFAKQQQSLDFTKLFNTLGWKRNLVNLNLSIGGQQSLPDLTNFGERLMELEYLSVFKIHLKGNNKVDYLKLQEFLIKVKLNKTLNLLSIKTGSQKSSEYRLEEKKQNAWLLQKVCLIGKPIIIYFSHLNDQISYQYNFDRLQLTGIQEVLSRDILMPIPSNQLVISIQEIFQMDNKYLKQIFSLIKEQEYIYIKVSKIEILYEKGISVMKASNLNEINQFLIFSDRQITVIQINEENVTWLNVKGLLTKLFQRQIIAEIPEFSFIANELRIIFKNATLSIMGAASFQLEQQEFQQFCEFLSVISYFEVKWLQIDLQIVNFNQDWNELSSSLINFQQLQYLDLKLKIMSHTEGSCKNYKSFHFNMFKIFIMNKYLTKYDYFSEKEIFPIQLQLHLGSEIKDLEAQILQQGQQVQRILNGQPNPGDQNIAFDQLQQSLQENKKDLEQRNKDIKEGLQLERIKRKVLLKRRRLTYQYFAAMYKFSSRLNKQQMICDIMELL